MSSAVEKPGVIIYADPLLPPSATFIRSQAESIRDFVPYYVGARGYPNGGLKLAEERTLLINWNGTNFGKIREIPFKVFGYAPSFFRSAQEWNPVLVHAHTGPGGVSALPLARFLRVPLLTTFHGGDVTTFDRELQKHRQLTVRTYRRRKHELQSEGVLFIAVSKFVHGKLLEQGFQSGRTVLHYIGVDTAFFKPSPGISREAIVLFVGTLHSGKGCEYAIRAMEKVQSEFPGVEFVIVGNGPLRSSLEQMAKEKLKRYRFLGTQPPEVVRHWMNRAMIFLAPSVTADSGWTEAFGLVFVEAQSMCLPVVSFSSGGIPEAVSHEETGMLAPERDWEALACHVSMLLGNKTVWTRMSVAGRQRVLESFNLETQTLQLENCYHQVLQQQAFRKASALQQVPASRFVRGNHLSKVLIIQGQMKQYRAPFFQKLSEALRQDGVSLKVAYSSPQASDGRNDNCDLPPDLGVKVRGHWLFSGRMLYQPLLQEVAAADLVIAEQANKSILNYLLLVLSSLGIRRIAFWGLGENKDADRSEISEWLRRQIVSKVDRWFAYTRSTMDYLVSNGVSEDRITVVQNAVDTREFSSLVHSIGDEELSIAKSEFGIEPGSPIGLFCGGLCPDKGLCFLLEAAQRIKIHLPNFHLLIIGAGQEENVARAAAKAHPWIHYVGPKFGAEKALFFKMADVMLLPGRVGLAILDAFAAGLPLLTTNLPYHGPEVEYLANGINGFLTDHLVEAYASRCVSVFADDSVRSKLKVGAADSGLKYSIDGMVSSFCSGIRTCLGLPEKQPHAVCNRY